VTFELENNGTPVVVNLPNNSAYYNQDYWGRIITDLTGLGYTPFEVNNIKLLFIKGGGGVALGAQGCGGNCGLGMVGMDLFPEFNTGTYFNCPSGTGVFAFPCTPLGAAAHELGHCFGLPHPVDIPATSAVANRSIMQTHWNYPNYAPPSESPWGLLTIERQTLRANPFFQEGITLLQPYEAMTILNLPNQGVTPTANFSYNINNFTVTFSNSSTGANLYYWTFGDGAVSNQSDPTYTFPGYGIYTVRLRASNANSMMNMAIMTIPICNTIANAGSDRSITCANPTTTLSGAGSSTGGDIAYQWTGPGVMSGANTLMPVVSAPGTYTLTVTSQGSGCSATDEVVVTGSTTPPTANAGNDMAINCTNPSVALNGAGSTSGANIAYNWTGPGVISGGATLTPVVNIAGIYTLAVTNQTNGCTATDQVLVAGSTIPPTANAGADMTISCINPSVILNGVGSTSGANITYNWTGPGIVSGGTTLMPVVNTAGIYTLTVTNLSNGCMETDQALVMSNITLPIANAGADMTISCINPSVALNGGGSTIGADITYAWAGAGIVSGGVTLTPTVNIGGTYSLTVTNQTNGCSAIDQVIVTANNVPPTANAGDNQALTCTATSVMLNGSGSSSGANINYLWNGPGIISGSTTTLPVVNLAGIYTLTVTNQANGCFMVDEVVVSENTTLPTANAGDDVTITCANPTGILNGSNSSSGSNITYNWNGPGIVGGGATTIPVVNLSGAYTLTVTDQTNGCFSTDQVLVTSNTELPTANAGTDMAISCTNASVALNGTGSASGANITYAWSGPGIISGGATAMPIVNAAGVYTLTVTNQTNGCSTTDQVLIESNTIPPVANAGNSLTLTCTTPTVTLDATGSSSSADIVYAWAGPGIISGGTTQTPLVNVEGNYTLTVTNLNNGCSASNQTTVLSDTTPPIANAGADLVITCGNTEVTLNGSSSSSGMNITYSWTGPGIVGGGTTVMPVVNLAGAYTLTTNNLNNGCLATDQVNVSVHTALGLDVQVEPANCFGDSTGTAAALAFGGNGNYTYNWSTGATSAQINGLPAGTYNVLATNGNCSATGTVTVSQPEALAVNVIATAETLPGASDGTAAVVVIGGTPDYTYLWSTGAITASITGLVPGTYNVTTSDSQGCIASATAEVNNSICSGFAIALTPTDMVCQDDMTGSVAASVAGGTGPFSYEWSNNAVEPLISGLTVGTYSVSVTDANNCILTASTTIALLPDLTPPVVVVQPLTVYLNAVGEVEITPEMADNGSLDNCGIVALQLSKDKFNCDEPGSQTVTFTAMDAAGNETSAAFSVTVLDTIAPALECPVSVNAVGCNLVYNYEVPTVLEICGEDLLTIPVELVSGLPSGSVFPTGETVMIMEATDPSGNSTFCSFNVNISNPPTPPTELVEPLCSGSADGSIRVVPFGDAAGYTYEWDDPAGQTDSIAVGLSAGAYNLIISGNSNGCVDTITYVLEEPAPVQITLDEIVAELFTTMNGAISVTASGGQGEPYTFIWRFNGQEVSSEQDLTGLSMGEYILNVVDINGCVATDTFVVDRLTNALEPALDYSLLLYPNPAEDQINLQIAGEKTASLEVVLLSIDGRLLHQPLHAFAAKHTFILNVADYVPGIYLVRIIIDGRVLWRKAVVER
jgi:hypothetical protein